MTDTTPQAGAGRDRPLPDQPPRAAGLPPRVPGPPRPGQLGAGSDAQAGGPRGRDGEPAGNRDQGRDTAATGRPTAGRRTAKQNRSFWRELPILIVVALFLTLVIKTYVIQAFYIPSGSMENTLGIGDRVLVNKLAFDFGSIHRGDIIVFSGNGTWNADDPPLSHNFVTRFVDSAESMVGRGPVDNDYIKRVIGLPGDHVACCDSQGDVTVNGVPLHEQSYLYPGNQPSQQPFHVRVPPGSLWVMGDHRDVSYDSRGHTGSPGGGSIPESAVVGQAFVIIWPPSQWRILSVPKTFDQRQLTASAAAGRDAGGSAAALSGAVPVHSGGSGLPLALGFAGAVPVTWLQRRLRPVIRRLARRRGAR